jgi:hypothetical protein
VAETKHVRSKLTPQRNLSPGDCGSSLVGASLSSENTVMTRLLRSRYVSLQKTNTEMTYRPDKLPHWAMLFGSIGNEIT